MGRLNEEREVERRLREGAGPGAAPSAYQTVAMANQTLTDLRYFADMALCFASSSSRENLREDVRLADERAAALVREVARLEQELAELQARLTKH